LRRARGRPSHRSAFLLNLEQRLERFCCPEFRPFDGDGRVRAAVRAVVSRQGPVGARRVAMRPDLTLERDGRHVLVLDPSERLPATRL